MTIALAMTRDQAGQLVIRHDADQPIAISYPGPGGHSVILVLDPDTTAALQHWETSRDEQEDARFDATWGQPRKVTVIEGKGRRGNLGPEEGRR